MPQTCEPDGQVAMSWPGRARRWAGWLLAGVLLDLAVWSQLGRIRALSDNPGIASALALCWVHAFLLPGLFDPAGRSLSRMLLCAAVGVAAVPVALVVGAFAGLNAGAIALLLGLAMGRGDGAAYHPIGEPLGVVLNVLSDILLWSGVVVGSAVAAIACVGLSALVPGLPRPRLSWRVLVGGGCAAIVMAPDWVVGFRQFPLREPAFLLAAALPSLVLVNWGSMTRGDF